jgi:uncharacterized membrane protein YfcA
LFVILIVSGFVVTIIAVVILKKEYKYKVAIGYKFCPGDFECTTLNSLKLPLIAFIGGMIAGSLGIGAGLIFNPIIIQMGVHPAVASATGMYMVIFTTTASSMVVILLNRLYVKYAIILAILTLIGSYPGVYMQSYIVMRNGGRQQYTVVILLFFIVFCLVLIPLLNVITLTQKASDGYDVFAWGSYC